MEIEETVVVSVPRWQAFQLAVQPENMPLWNRGVLESRLLGTLEEGAKVVQVARIFGQRFEILFEVTSYQPPRRVTYTSVNGPIDVRGTMKFVSKRDGTLLRWIVDGDCRGFLHVADGVLEHVGRQEMRASLRTLARLLEEMSRSPRASPAWT